MTGRVASRRLSEHFRESEFLSPGRRTIPAGHREELRRLCTKYLEPLRGQFGPVYVSSGFRTARHNAEVDGAPASRHLDLPGQQGAAADVWCERGRPNDWYDFLDHLGVGGLGLYMTHVHVDNRPGRARW